MSFADQLTDLLHDAVADVHGSPEVHAMAGRLRRVDHRRKMGVMMVGATALVGATFGVASAWPEHAQPIQLRVGTEVVESEDASADPPDPGHTVDASGEHDAATDESADSGPERDTSDDGGLDAPGPLLDDEAAEEQVSAGELELEWSKPFEFALPVSEPTPHPTPQPPVTPQPTPKPAVPADSGTKNGSGDSGSGAEADQKKKGRKKSGGGESQTVAFTAVAAYGTCEEPIPYDLYSGTAPAGASVTITSPYSATTSVAADGSGKWSLEITFEAAPVGQPFTVTVTSGGKSVGLGFTRTG